MITEIQWIRCECDRCGTKWVPRSDRDCKVVVPLQCSHCRRRDWDNGKDIAENTAEGRVGAVGSGSSGDGRGLSDVE